MTTRSRGPLAGFRWLTQGISAGYRHPKPLLGGAAIVLLACLLPSLLVLPMQLQAAHAGTPPSPAMFVGLTALSMVLSLLILPLYAGYLQVVDTAERGLPTRAVDIFKPYRQGEALRLIGYGLAMLAIYVVLFGAVLAVNGHNLVNWYAQALAAQASHQPPPTGLPSGFGTTFALFMLVGLFMTGFYAISLGQIALRGRNVFGAIGDGMLGALKNLLPLLVFALSCALAWIVLTIALAILVILLTLLAKLISTWLVFVVVVPLYVALFLAMFTVMFGVMYHLWRDVCDDGAATGMASAIAA